MNYTFKTSEFELSYVKSINDGSILWENHCHARFEMIAVLEGNVNVMIEGKRYCLKENQIIIIPPLCYHSITINKSGIYKRITGLFDLSTIPSVLQSEFAKKDTDINVFYSTNLERLKEACKKVNATFYAPLVKSLIIQIFYEALKTTNKQAETEIKTDDFLQKVVSYIDQHLLEKILLDDIARHVLRSKSSFCHLFEEKMKISPKQYILQKKLALASKLISEGTPPTIASMQLGYDNYSNFYRIYLKHFGVSPAKNK